MDKKKEMVKVGVEMAKVGMEMAKLEVERTKVEIEMANLSSHIEEKQGSRSQMDVIRAIPQNNNASLPSPSGRALPPPPPPPPSSNGTPLSKKADSPVSGRDAILNQIRQGRELNDKEESDKQLEKMLDSKGDQLLKKADSPVSDRDALHNQIKQGFKLRNKEDSDKWLEKKLGSKRDQLLEKADSPVSDRDALHNQIKQGFKLRNKEDSDKWLEKKLGSKRDQLLEKANGPVDIHGALLRKINEAVSGRRKHRCPSSDSNLSGPPNSDDWSNNGGEEQDKQSSAPAQADASIEAAYETDSDEELGNYENEFLNFQLDNEKESGRPDSGYKSKSSSPLDFESEAEKPQAPASLQEEPSVTKVNNVDLVNSRA